MSALRKKSYLREEAYLEFEEQSDVKHEYVDGAIHAMAGAGLKHNQITGNLFFQLRSARSKNSGCKIFTSDMKLRIENGRFYYYPDVVLSCEKDDGAESYIEKPCFIAEVLSKSTARIDQNEKWQTYQNIPSLRYYLLVDSRQKKIDYFMRNELNEWLCDELTDNETLSIKCENFTAVLTLADIYEEVNFNAQFITD
jgi:Uma2 family endonuclease